MNRKSQEIILIGYYNHTKIGTDAQIVTNTKSTVCNHKNLREHGDLLIVTENGNDNENHIRQ